jgi:formylmethanofuran dehydrogenase subunit B
MRGHFNVVGADQVPTWEVGFPYAIDFSRGYARFSPGEFSVTEILRRKDCDSALVVSSDPAAHLPARSVKHLADIPVIQIDPHPNLTTRFAKVVIPSSLVGIEAEGTVYRMDGIPMRLKKFKESEYLSDEEILERLYHKVVELMGA